MYIVYIVNNTVPVVLGMIAWVMLRRYFKAGDEEGIPASGNGVG